MGRFLNEFLEKSELEGKTNNTISKYNELMQPDNIVITKKDFIKIQENSVNSTEITKEDIDSFQ